MQRTDFIKAVDEYSEATDRKPSSICQYAIANRKFYDRVKNGYFHEGRAKAVLDWMAENPPVQGEAAE